MSKEAVSLSRVRKINYNVVNWCLSKVIEAEKDERAQDIQSAQAELSREGSLNAEVVMIHIILQK